MKTIELDVPSAVGEMAQRLEHAGYETWAVGGAVRDALLGVPAGDWDLATRARPRDVQRLFKRTIPIGIDHGTVGVLARDGTMYEVTTFRRDVETFGRHAVVEFADTIEDDLSRRDFTFNAIAWHPLTHELRDPYDGFADLRSARLRTVGRPEQRLAEDYLRILRALRFAGHFTLQIEAETWSALQSSVQHLTMLSAERLREELWKVLAKTRHASATLKLYEQCGVLAVLYPELEALVQLERELQVPVWTHTLAAVDAISPARPGLRMAALLHAVGMSAARARDLRGGWRFTGHEVQGARIAEDIMRRLKSSNADVERVATLVRIQAELFPPDAPAAGVRRWLRYVSPFYVYDLFRLRIALCRALQESGSDLLERWHHAHRILLQHPALDVAGLAIGGAELKRMGLKPGPRYGEILEILVQRVIDRPELNRPDQLSEIVRAELLP